MTGTLEATAGTYSASYRVRVLRVEPMLFITGESSSIFRGPLDRQALVVITHEIPHWM